jgi:hypothetical protein
VGKGVVHPELPVRAGERAAFLRQRLAAEAGGFPGTLPVSVALAAGVEAGVAIVIKNDIIRTDGLALRFPAGLAC